MVAGDYATIDFNSERREVPAGNGRNVRELPWRGPAYGIAPEHAAAAAERVTVKPVARQVNATEHHIAKAVTKLAELGLVDSHGGRTGGIFLTDHGRTATVGQIVRGLEGRGEVVECVGANPCPPAAACRLRHMLADAQESFYRDLDRYTLDDLVDSRTVGISSTENRITLFPGTFHRSPRSAHRPVRPQQSGAGRATAGAGRIDSHLRHPSGGSGTATSAGDARTILELWDEQPTGDGRAGTLTLADLELPTDANYYLCGGEGFLRHETIADLPDRDTGDKNCAGVGQGIGGAGSGRNAARARRA